MSAEQLIVLVGLIVLTIGRAIKQLLEQRAEERQRGDEMPRAEIPSQVRLEPPQLDRGPRIARVLAPARLRVTPAHPIVAPILERRAFSPSRRMLRRDLNNPKRAMVLLAVFGPPRAETLTPRAREPRPPRAR